MNLVLDEAEEVYVKKGHRKQLGMNTCIAGWLLAEFKPFLVFTGVVATAGRILLKGDNITLMQVCK